MPLASGTYLIPSVLPNSQKKAGVSPLPGKSKIFRQSRGVPRVTDLSPPTKQAGLSAPKPTDRPPQRGKRDHRWSGRPPDLERATGFEPATPSLGSLYSTS